MDSATGWILGICGALIGGVILLFIEYGYFQKRKVSNGAPGIGGKGNSLWKDAINRAVQDFGKNHTDSTIKISSWTVLNDKAQVYVYLRRKPPPSRLPQRPSFQRLTWYTLTVDKEGDILEIRHRCY